LQHCGHQARYLGVRAAALREELQALGWTEGRNLHIEYRWGAVNPDLISSYTAELIERAPEVIVTSNTAAVQVLRRSASAIPTGSRVFRLSDPRS
jgi:hypothetical protein